ncbi:MAG: hypothetical protein ACP5F3_04585 [Candidatus Syntrophosphaera sp.]
MKNVLFYGSRILFTVILIGLLSMLGIGNPKAVPYFILFFIAVFAIVYFLNKKANERAREEKSGSALNTILQFVGLVIFVGALSLIGLTKGIIGYIIWFAVIAVIVLAIYLSLRSRQQHFELTEVNSRAKNIYSIIFAVLSVVVPVLIIRFGGVVPIAAGREVLAIIVPLIGVLAFIALLYVAIVMINKKGEAVPNRVLGYALIILASILPGIIMLFVDTDTSSFAGVYLAALVATILSYIAFELKYKLS